MSDVALVVAILLVVSLAIGTSLYAAVWTTRRVRFTSIAGAPAKSVAAGNFFIRLFVFVLVFAVVFGAWGPVFFMLSAIFD